MLRQEQLKSLEILKQFVASTSSEDLAAMAAQYQRLDPGGYTYDEYLQGFDAAFSGPWTIVENTPSIKFQPVSYAWPQSYFFIPPIWPPNSSEIICEKDLANFAGSFFLLHLKHGRGHKCTI